jgi:L-rhamnose mutarotase
MVRAISLGFLILILLYGCNSRNTPANNTVDHDLPTKAEQVMRYGSVIKLKPEKYDLYKELHANPWSGVDSLLKLCNIRNYSIYYRDGFLFSYLEYTGNDYAGDMARLGDEPILKEWWKLTDPCQEPLETAAEGEWWAPMEELYHLE